MFTALIYKKPPKSGRFFAGWHKRALAAGTLFF
jgi:hypothetical protein